MSEKTDFEILKKFNKQLKELKEILCDHETIKNKLTIHNGKKRKNLKKA